MVHGLELRAQFSRTFLLQNAFRLLRKFSTSLVQDLRAIITLAYDKRHDAFVCCCLFDHVPEPFNECHEQPIIGSIKGVCDATTGESGLALYTDPQCNVLLSEMPYTNTECAPCENLSCGYTVSCTDDGECTRIFRAFGAFDEERWGTG